MKVGLKHCAAAAVAAAGVNAVPISNCSQEDLAWAYEYAYPLYAYGNVAKPLPAIVPPNFLAHSPGLAEPGSIPVVRPNADTVYSVVMYDLSVADLAITIPEMPTDRFWVYPIVTPYGDILVRLGSINKTPAGKYLLKYNPDGKWGLEIGDDVPEDYAGIIHYPMAYGLTTMRIAARNTPEEEEHVSELHSGFRIEPVIRLSEPIAPRLDLSMFNETQYNDGHDQGDGYFQDVLRVAARLEPYCPTYVVEDREMVAERLRRAGFNGEEWELPRGTDLIDAVAMANTTSAELMDSISINVGNDWTIYEEEYIGLYNSHYDARYYIASWLYLGLTPDQAIYPSYQKDLNLTGEQSVMFTFTEPPRISDAGFWSITAYGPDQDLIANDLQRYSIGSQYDITFPDGSPVSVDSNQKVFQILVQPTHIEPPSNWTSNWLPINFDGGQISATLRWYGSEEYMSNGSYVHPKVEIIKPITT